MTALALAFRSVGSIAASICFIENAVGFSMALKDVILCKHGFLRIEMSSVRCKLFDTPNILEP